MEGQKIHVGTMIEGELEVVSLVWSINFQRNELKSRRVRTSRNAGPRQLPILLNLPARLTTTSPLSTSFIPPLFLFPPAVYAKYL